MQSLLLNQIARKTLMKLYNVLLSFSQPIQESTLAGLCRWLVDHKRAF